MGANDLAPAVLYQSTNHHVNADGKNNDDSQSHETPRGGGIVILPLLVIE